MKNKKLVAIITLLCFALTFVPFTAFANDTELEQAADGTVTVADTEPDTTEPIEIDSGTCGDNVTWKLTDDGVLTISGSGEMKSWSSFSWSETAPWYDNRALIQSVVIDNEVSSIGDYAFNACSNLIRITIPDSVKRIGDGAFYGCKSLLKVTIPNSVTSIGSSAFMFCEALTDITIPDSVTNIGGIAFSRCQSLTEITIPKYVTEIDGYTFAQCKSLTEVTIPKGVQSIGEGAFEMCTSLTEVKIPDSVTNISSGAFADCTALTEIIIPNGVTSIDNWVFKGCTSLAEVTIPNKVASIGFQAFQDCSSLTEIIIPDSVISISMGAFSNCTGLKTVEISDTITTMNQPPFENYNQDAFENCALEHIKFRGTRTKWDAFKEGEGKSIFDALILNGIVTCICKNDAHTLQESTTATCTDAGIKTIICSECDYREEETVAALGHNLKKEEEIAPTCTTDGYTLSKCSRCDYEEQSDIVKAPGQHGKTELQNQKKSTTTEEGYTGDEVCTVCGATVKKGETIPATGTGGSSGSSGGSGGFTGSYNHPVGVDDVDNAAVSLDKSNAIAGETVTITVTPEAGKVVDIVTVTDKDNHALNVTKVGDNQYQFVMPNGAVKIAVTTKAAVYGERIVLQIDNRNVLVNNYTITNDVAPVIVDNRTMVPIRIVTETLGGTADWNEESRTVTLHIDGKTLRMTIDQIIEGFDVPPVILNERTYVPVRYVAEKLGAKVDWIAETQQIIVTK